MSAQTELKAPVQCMWCYKNCALCGNDRKGCSGHLYICSACSRQFSDVCCFCKKHKSMSPALLCRPCYSKRKPGTCYYCGCKGKEILTGKWF